MNIDYELLISELKALLSDSPTWITSLSNASALLFERLENINWAGFYLVKDNQLVLGPFQGKVACTVIPVGKGVCGTAVKLDSTQLVDDVHTFKGHIACDSASMSEIVIPIHVDKKVWGVLDIDSPTLANFSDEDRIGLEEFVSVLEKSLSCYKLLNI